MKLLPAILILCVIGATLGLSQEMTQSKGQVPSITPLTKCPPHPEKEIQAIQAYMSNKRFTAEVAAAYQHNIDFLTKCTQTSKPKGDNKGKNNDKKGIHEPKKNCPADPVARINEINYIKMVSRLTEPALKALNDEIAWLEKTCLKNKTKKLARSSSEPILF